MKKIILLACFTTILYATLSAQLLLDVAGEGKIEKRLIIGNNTDYNMFIGEEAGLSTTINVQNGEGVENTIVGNQAGKLNTTGSYNAFFGFLSGHHNTTGTRNTFLGARTGFSNTIGNNNVFIGDAAGQSNLEGNDNTFVGKHAGISNKDGETNTFIGALTGVSNTSGGSNTFVGWHSGYFNQTGQANTFIGRAAGHNSISNDNTMVGFFSGLSNKGGSRNTFFGAGSGQTNIDGSDNVYIGHSAGRDNLLSYNTIIGNYAGAENSGSTNTLIGFKAGELSGTGAGNIFIGFEAGRNETNSNRLYIENSSSATPLIYGEFDNDKVQINGSLNILEFMRLMPSAAPSTPEKGTMYYDSSDDKVKVWNGSTWENLFFTSSTQTENSFALNNELPCNTACYEESLQLKVRVAQLETKLKAYDAMQSKVAVMDKLLSQLLKEADLTSKKIEIGQAARLAQNSPNPFKGTTHIPYFIPLNSQTASIRIYNATGQIIDNINIENFGKGAIDLQVTNLPNGIYHYLLEVDGQIIVTKKMSFIR